ncbi:MAG: UDP-N-acetylglucosamine 2-epimerase [Actinobacteria bacterium]|nr:UDP-N-acetylglucosamine 2-epimerase [Actinomycetota bacterium]
MLIVFYGTTGELIKIAPLLLRMEPTEYFTLCTGQQVEQIPAVLREFGLPDPDRWIGSGFRGRDLSRTWHVPVWGLEVLRRFASERSGVLKRLADSPRPNLAVIHGDTITTVLGGLLGRFLGLPVAHIEAGLRSHNWLNPFPEELDRLAASRLAHIHFAPGELAVKNLAGVRGNIVNTQANTISDSLQLAPTVFDSRVPKLDQEFGIASIHRNELIGNRQQFRALLDLLRSESRRIPILFVDHPVTASKIASYGFGHLFDEARFIRIPKLSYFAFITLLKRSEFLVTDSGGVQEECYHLDHPCLVHRTVTERSEGLGRNVALSRLDLGVVSEFLRDPGLFRQGSIPAQVSPTQIIYEYMVSNDFIR